jgi:hypothetical protein
MQVNLSWAGVTGALFYNVFRGTSSGGPYQLIGQSNPNPGLTAASANIVTTYQDGPNNLPNGLNFYYVISVVTADGESPYSAEVAALWPGAASAPSNPIAVVS